MSLLSTRLKSNCFITVTLFFFILLTPNHFAQSTTEEKLTGFARALIEYNEYPSLAIGAAEKDKIVWQSFYGYANIEDKIAVKPNTLFRIASVSKVVTATAILQLVEKGKVKLDEDVRTYIPYYTKKKFPFTVRQVLNHTSGLRAYKDGEFESNRHFKSTKEVIQYLDSDTLVAQPGTKYIYSSLGYNILSAIIESVTKLSFEEYLKQNIFKPAGMNFTKLDYKGDVKDKAIGYRWGKTRLLEKSADVDLSIKYPGGGIVSTLEDLLKFGLALMNYKLISKPTLDLMFTPSKLSNGRVLDYGLGVSIGKTNDKSCYGHIGTGTGFLSGLSIFPDERIVTAYLVNLQDNFVMRPAEGIYRIYRNNENLDYKKPLLNTLVRITSTSDANNAVKYYNQLKHNYPNLYDYSQYSLLQVGEYFYKGKQNREAIVFYDLCATEYPNSVDAFNKLGDAYLADKNKGLAIKNYKNALRIDPSNKYAKEKLKTLSNLR